MRPDALTDASDTTIEHGNARLGAERPRATSGLKLGIVRLGRAAGKVSPIKGVVGKLTLRGQAVNKNFAI